MWVQKEGRVDSSTLTKLGFKIEPSIENSDTTKPLYPITTDIPQPTTTKNEVPNLNGTDSSGSLVQVDHCLAIHDTHEELKVAPQQIPTLTQGQFKAGLMDTISGDFSIPPVERLATFHQVRPITISAKPIGYIQEEAQQALVFGEGEYVLKFRPHCISMTFHVRVTKHHQLVLDFQGLLPHSSLEDKAVLLGVGNDTYYSDDNLRLIRL